MNNHLSRSIRHILMAGSAGILAAGVIATANAALGQQNPPPGPGQMPDYFGVVPNFATSPQPVMTTVTISDPGDGVTQGTGATAAATIYDYVNNVSTDGVTDVQILNGGSGYSANTTVTINGGPGVITPADVSPVIVNGVIVGFHVVNPGEGYSKAPIAGTGIRKFVDRVSLPELPGIPANGLGQSLPIASPDKNLFPGADYYEIAVVSYTQKLHSDLPPTHLRGYQQLDPVTHQPIGTPQYLGPVIIAQKDRPVRVKLVNQLPLSTTAAATDSLNIAHKADELPFPVDTTYMGSNTPNDTQNRVANHLHGGNTPWISDGTPRQTMKPAGDANNKGDSVRYVPDMWFSGTTGELLKDVNGAAITNEVAAKAADATATNNPGDGAQTYFYTNQQSARLMFYHDHAEGITRLNVYDGVAAGYILTDPVEQDLVNGTNVSGTNPTSAKVIPADTIPLIIQDKTFVPDNTKPVLNFYGPFRSQLESQDPTWRWGHGWQYNVGVAAPTVTNGTVSSTAQGTGDLWVPHVYMPNQNPGDVSGANAMGRWDYGPWFWPPFAGLMNGPIPNPYYDPSCVSSTTQYCEGKMIPGTPNGANGTSPAATAEAFNDTPMVNGTVYPYIEVEPKKYRLRILSAANDRMFNLSMFVAASKNSETHAIVNAGANHPAVNCDGTPPVGLAMPNQADCTEVRMVPWDVTQDATSHFPAWWYTKQKTGITFDGRPSGVPDPAMRGPAMVQIGTEGGFLATPAVIKNQPVNYEYNVKNIQVGNIKEHALLLGPAERADVVVDFANYAGSTIILYNDAPAPVPANDLRLDYYTRGSDNTDTGGAMQTQPGYGPNSRTIMQFRVAASCNAASNCGAVGSINRGSSTPAEIIPDDVDPVYLTTLTKAVQTAFRVSQEPPVVAQAAYDPVYGTTVLDATGTNLSGISTTQLTFRSYVDDVKLRDPSMTATMQDVAGTLDFQPKTIIEDFSKDYGRMNALLGVEVPRTTAINQTSVPESYLDPATELVRLSQQGVQVQPTGMQLEDGTQLWKITHNGVDSHPIHFHLFHVQLINRVGWDGAMYPPEPNEIGWKDTVRMNPLADVIVALRPMYIQMSGEKNSMGVTIAKGMDFKVPNSHRKLDPNNSGDGNMLFNLNPTSGNLSNAVDANGVIDGKLSNYGWEYVWHCHILGHEENDMMRAIPVASAPEVPIGLTVIRGAAGDTLSWKDNSVVANWFTIQRATDAGFTTDSTNPGGGLTNFDLMTAAVAKNATDLANGECRLQTGCDMTTTLAAAAGQAYYYRVVAHNTVGQGDGVAEFGYNPGGSYKKLLSTDHPTVAASLTPNYTGFSNITASSAPSNVASVTPGLVPAANLSPKALAFTTQLVNTTAVQDVTLTNPGTKALTISGIAVTGAGFSPAAGGANACSTASPLAVNSSCTISVQFNPLVTGNSVGTLTVTDDAGNVAGSQQTVALSGSAGAPSGSVAPTSLLFPATNITTPATPGAAKMVTISNGAGSYPLTINSVAFSNPTTTPFAVAAGAGTCPTSVPFNVPAGTSCTLGVVFAPTTKGTSSGTLTISDNAATPKSWVVNLAGTGVYGAPAITTIADSFTRANGALGASWTYSNSNLKVNANQAWGENAGSAFWGTVLGPVQSAGFTLVSGFNNASLYLKGTGNNLTEINPNTGVMMNTIRLRYTTNARVQVSYTTNGGTFVTTGISGGGLVSTGTALKAGDSLLATVDNTGVVWIWKVVVNPTTGASTTTLLTTKGIKMPVLAVNPALWTTGGGKVGMYVPNNGRVDNFIAQ